MRNHPIPEFTSRQRQRFLGGFKPDPETGCWNWQLSRETKGYGRFRMGKRSYRAHRVSYAFHNGRDPGDLLVCHECDNRLCVNPDHLWLGTEQDNNLDMRRKGRDVPGCPQRHTVVAEAIAPPPDGPVECIRCGHLRTDDYVHTGRDGQVRRSCRNCKAIRNAKRSNVLAEQVPA